MKKYRGYYIDGIIFKSTAEIDAFLRETAIKAYKQAIRHFEKYANMEASIYADQIAQRLHRVHGLTWEEIESIEIKTLTA